MIKEWNISSHFIKNYHEPCKNNVWVWGLQHLHYRTDIPSMVDYAPVYIHKAKRKTFPFFTIIREKDFDSGYCVLCNKEPLKELIKLAKFRYITRRI